MQYKDGISELEAFGLIYGNIIVEDEYQEYKKCKEAVIGKTMTECANVRAATGLFSLALHPALYRHLDKNEYGGFWIPKRPLCLEHFIFGGIVIPLLYYGAFYVHYLLLYLCDIILKWI